MRRENVLGDKNNTSKELKIAGQGGDIGICWKGQGLCEGKWRKQGCMCFTIDYWIPNGLASMTSPASSCIKHFLSLNFTYSGPLLVPWIFYSSSYTSWGLCICYCLWLECFLHLYTFYCSFLFIHYMLTQMSGKLSLKPSPKFDLLHACTENYL